MNPQGEKVNVFEVLLLLPVRSLLRFRCVCKEWCELIDSCFFKDRYLAFRRARALDDQVVGLNITSIDDDVVRFIYKISITCWYGNYQSVARSASDPLSSNIFEISGIFTGPIRNFSHVNGIVCFFSGENWFDIILVNPALREIRKLPVPEFDLGGFERTTQGSGFGYDDVCDEYKVVAIVTVFEGQDNYNSPYKHTGIVYHLSTNSWKILGDMSEFVSRPFQYLGYESVFSHGSIHWIMTLDIDDYMRCYWILAFDVTNELFREMPFPHGWSYFIYDEYNMFPHLFTIDKSTVALVSSSLQTYDVPKIEVWVMNEYGDTDSWTKLYSINNLPTFRCVISFWKKDKLLLLSEAVGWICYDLLKGQLVDEPEQFSLEDGILIHGLELVTGHESFVSVKQV